VSGAAPLRAVAEARRALAECLAAESEAERALAVAEAAIWNQRDAASAPSEDDEAVEAFASWLPQGRRAAAAAQAALDRAAAAQHPVPPDEQPAPPGTPMRRRGDVPPQ
jgi:hypothetical protein